MTMQPTLFDDPQIERREAVKAVLGSTPRFKGKTFDKKLDGKRLTGQALRVFELMRDGRWRTLREISDGAHGPEASVSARLRDFRGMGHTVESQRRGNTKHGVWEYRLTEKQN